VSRSSLRRWQAYEELRRRTATNYGYELTPDGPKPVRGAWRELKHVYELPPSGVHGWEHKPNLHPLVRRLRRVLEERGAWRRRRWYEGEPLPPLEWWE
jgi:hypothetical protein